MLKSIFIVFYVKGFSKWCIIFIKIILVFPCLWAGEQFALENKKTPYYPFVEVDTRLVSDHKKKWVNLTSISRTWLGDWGDKRSWGWTVTVILSCHVVGLVWTVDTCSLDTLDTWDILGFRSWDMGFRCEARCWARLDTGVALGLPADDLKPE